MNHADHVIEQARERLSAYYAHVDEYPHVRDLAAQENPEGLTEADAEALERFYLLELRAREAMASLRAYGLPVVDENGGPGV